MDFSEWKKKKKEEEQEETPMTFSEWRTEKYGVEMKPTPTDNDIAPVTAQEDEEAKRWYQKIFKGGSLFDDGYQFGDVYKTVVATTEDLKQNIYKGFTGIAEGTIDFGAGLVGAVGGLLGANEFKAKTEEFIDKDLINEDKIADVMRKVNGGFASDLMLGKDNYQDASVSGDTMDSLAQTGGELLGMYAIPVGKGAKGIKAATTARKILQGATIGGHEIENALHQDATFDEAVISGLVSGGAAALLSELGSIKFGGSTIPDAAKKKLATTVSNSFVRTMLSAGRDIFEEGAEEVLEEYISDFGKWLTYQDEKTFQEMFLSQEALDAKVEAFFGGGLFGGFGAGAKVANSIKTGRDYTSGMTANEEKVFKKVYEDRLAEEAEKKGRKLKQSEKNEIYDKVMHDLEKGYIDTDTIEEVLGGKTYESYKSAIAEEDALKKEFAELGKMKKSDFTAEQDDRYNELKQKLAEMKEADQIGQLKSQLTDEVQKGFMLEEGGKTRLIDTRLAESYNERARRGQAFEADLSKYDEKQQATVKKAIESGILNNTNRTHELVDMIAKISADKGVLFDFTNNKRLKESGFAVDGVDVNGYVTKDGITINIDSHKALNSIVGHEIAHVLGAEHNKALRDALFKYAKNKGDYQSRYDALTKLYKGVKGANIEAELVADLVGDYLFTDKDFVNHLANTDRSVFQKIFDEIKYLWKVATAGSKEKRELEKIKHTFEQAYRESGKTIDGTKYALSEAKIPTRKELESKAPIKVIDITTSKTQGTFAERRKQILDNVEEVISKPYLNRDTNTMIFLTKKSYTHAFNNLGDIQLNAAEHLPELIENAILTHAEKASHGDSHADGVYTFFAAAGYGQVHPVKLKVKEYTYSGQELPKNIKEYFENSPQGYASSYDTVVLEVEEIEKSPIGSVKDANQNDSFLDPNGLSTISIADLLNLVKGDAEKYIPKFSLSDSDGKKLTKEQSEYFKDSNQIKSVANANPTGDADIRYSLSNPETDKTYLDAVKRGDTETAQKMVDEVAKNAGYTIKAYHGTPNAEFTVFDEDRVGKGNDQYGAGFYFTTNRGGARRYGGRVVDACLDIKNPIKMTVDEDVNNLIQADVTLTSEQAYEIVKRLPGIYDSEESPLGDYYDAYWEDGAQDWMIMDLAEQYRDVGYLDSDLFRYYPNELHEALRDVVGYDGVEVTFENTGDKFYVAWFPEQIKSADPVTYDNNGNVIPLSERFKHDNKDIRYSLSQDGNGNYGTYRNSISREGEAPVKYGNFNISGDDVRLEAPMGEVAPVQEGVAENATTTPTSSKMEQVEGYAPITEEEANALQSENIDSLTDADAPPEMEAPYYGETEDAAPVDPFESRDIKAVGNRKVKAYMYENPEVKPFFQKEANIMLGELERTQKGERYYTSVPGGVPGEYGAESYGVWSGKPRNTTQDIEYLLDTLNFSYADIERGLKAIIEDNGAENNAASKRIEFLLNDRLLNGYQGEQGYDIPADQDYINLLNEKQIREYSEEARKSLFDDADAYAPQEDIAPIAEGIAPVKEQYEAIKPKREKTTEPRLKRVKDENTSASGKQRKWIGTSTDSDAVDGKVKPDDIPDEVRYYQPIPNKVTLGNANAKLGSMGYESSVAYFNSQFANKRVSLDDIALGERLIQEAVKRGDTKTAGELIQNVAILGTELGQKVQALSIIKRLTPEGQLRMLQKTVERGKTKGDKAFEGVKITQEMIDKILGVYAKTSDETMRKLQEEIAKLDGAKLTRTDSVYVDGDTYKHRKKLKELGFKFDADKKAWFMPDVSGTYDQAKLNEAVEDVKKQIADQMKVTKLEKVNAWRYLSMLGNPKTHIRNLVSNVAMRGTVAVKNAVARTIESVAPIGNRTKTWKRASDAVKAFSEKTAVDMKDVLSDGGKYSEEASIKAKRDTFKNKVLNKVYNLNSDLLSKEDWWFSKPAFTSALSEYLTANGIETEQDIAKNPEIVAKAKQYATEQSQIATFRQYSWLANKINDIEKHNAATNIAVGAVLPFKKTPINIAKTALNYSPLGFAKTLTYDVSQVKNGKMEASELVDHLSQNITGTALTLVGYMLASSGFLNGGGEDDKEGKYDYQLGEQAYSINIGDATFSLSWLSPIAMPLFVGANAYEQLVEGKEWNGDVVMETLAQTLDPLSEMSFLSSLDSVLSSYDSGIQKFAGIAQSAAQSYATQFIPTLSSQVAAVMDDTKRTTKVAGDSGFKFVDETINNLKYKIPFLRETLEPSTDIWGNEVKQTEDMLTRAFETFIAPYSKREDIATAIDSEIKSLYRMTGDDGLIPSIPYNYVNYKNEKYEMSAKEYTAYKETYGQTAYNLLGELFDTETYQYASDEDKAEMVNKVYDYARDLAKQEFLTRKGVNYTNATKDGEAYYREDGIKGAIENNMTLDEYAFYREYPERYAVAKSVGGYEKYKTYSSELYDIKADKDESGKSITGSRKEKVIDYINNLDADYGEKIILFKSEYKADDTYNYEIIDYLNNRDDISYEEMEAILKELGFTVKADGTVTWD